MYDLNELTPMLDLIIIIIPVLIIMSTIDKLIRLLKMYFRFLNESPFDSHNSKVSINTAQDFTMYASGSRIPV